MNLWPFIHEGHIRQNLNDIAVYIPYPVGQEKKIKEENKLW